MPQVSADIYVPIPPDLAFAVSQTTGTVRLRWDRFIRRQHFLGGATAPAKGVRTQTYSRLGPGMVSEYAAYRPPTSVGMTMVSGPWFFARFGGGWRFMPEGAGTRAVWKYTYEVRPAWLRPVGHRLGQIVLGHEIRRRIRGYAAGCADEVVLAAARASLSAARGPIGADPSGPDPSGPDPSGPDPSGSDPSGPDPSGPDLSGSDLSGPDPSGSDLPRADLPVSDPSGSERPAVGEP